MVITKGEEKNWNLWRLGKVVKLIFGHDGTVHGARVQTGKRTMERTPKHLYPLELSCGLAVDVPMLNPEAPSFQPRKRAAEAAKQLIKI